MPHKHAVILSGGGAKGAYEIGVMKALLAGYSRAATGGAPIEPVVYTGTSVGAFNAAYLTSYPSQAPKDTLAELENIWRNRIAGSPTRENGVLRFRANPMEAMSVDMLLADPMAPLRHFFQDGAFFLKDAIERGELFFKSKERLTRRLIQLLDFSAFVSTNALESLVRELVDLERVRNNTRQALIIAATNWEQGEVKLFGNLPPVGELDELCELDDKIGHLAILASTAIPGVFPPVEIFHTKYVDGGLLLNTPLGPSLMGLRAMAPAPDDDYVVHVIYLDPDLRDVPLDQGNNTMDTLNRFNALSFASQVNRDVKRARYINQTLELLGADAGAGPRGSRALNEVKASFKAFIKPEHRPITIHRYHPCSTLGGIFGLLSFESDYVGHLIEQGFQDAVSHDCQVSGCIFPTMKEAVAASSSARPSAEQTRNEL